MFLNYSDKGSPIVRLSVGNHLIAFLISLEAFVRNFIDSSVHMLNTRRDFYMF